MGYEGYMCVLWDMGIWDMKGICVRSGIWGYDKVQETTTYLWDNLYIFVKKKMKALIFIKYRPVIYRWIAN